jgi:hypothetical protein
MSTNAWSRTLVSIALLSFTAAASAGCVGEAPDDLDDAGESFDANTEALSPSWKCDVASLGADRCQAALADVRAQAAAAGRDEIVERGIDWLENGNTYDRSRYFEGFRRDCSGFVSMAWEISQNPSTAYFPPFVNGTYAVKLGSLDELAPGDAVNKTYRNPFGHVMLFAGWAAADHSQLYFMHHYSTGKPVALIKVSRQELGDFIAIRSVSAPPPAASAPPVEEPPITPPQAGCGALLPGQALGTEQAAFSCDGRFALVQQGDGNLVLYKVGAEALWWTGTQGKSGVVTVMQDDGNLVSYAEGGVPVWSSGTPGHPGAWLAVQDDGNLVIYTNKAIWNSGTQGH